MIHILVELFLYSLYTLPIKKGFYLFILIIATR